MIQKMALLSQLIVYRLTVNSYKKVCTSAKYVRPLEAPGIERDSLIVVIATDPIVNCQIYTGNVQNGQPNVAKNLLLLIHFLCTIFRRQLKKNSPSFICTQFIAQAVTIYEYPFDCFDVSRIWKQTRDTLLLLDLFSHFKIWCNQRILKYNA